jgi:hypothetical protein
VALYTRLLHADDFGGIFQQYSRMYPQSRPSSGFIISICIERIINIHIPRTREEVQTAAEGLSEQDPNSPQVPNVIANIYSELFPYTSQGI